MQPENASDWLVKAAADLQTVVLIGGAATSVPTICCFHCQQATEKALKALLAALAVEPARTHDIRVLIQELESRGHPIATELRERAVSLTAYAVQFRYPGLNFEPEAQEAGYAIRASTDIVRWALTQLGLSARDAGLEILHDHALAGSGPEL